MDRPNLGDEAEALGGKRPRHGGLRVTSLMMLIAGLWYGAPSVVAAQEGPKAPATEREQFFVEAGLALNGSRNDAYTERLEQFGFRPEDGLDPSDPPSLVATASAGYLLNKHFGVLLRYEGLEHRRYHRDLSGPSGNDRDDTFSWSTRGLSVGARGRLPFVHEWLALYGELDVGWAFSRTQMSGVDLDHSEHFDGLLLGARAGFIAHASRTFGFFIEGGVTRAAVIENLIGETHDDGGIVVSTGFRIRTLGESL